ncbi:putative tetraspanin-19 [Anguilla anguilla]|uniref:putative tetraspanin-19 n=1 Tax=Anguilla anguilla TaxID=7936 RepID=UPI0015AB403A|nr:putative tetraspanin-19 [Anguilla anguilla]XP_035257296.1 putative tetraspanin-19 [Anguilla anguilla]
MKVEERIPILKFFLMVFNGIFVIIGLAVFGCGIWILFDKSSFVVTIGDGQMKTVAGGLFMVGLVAVGVSVLGYIAISKEIRLLIILYMILLIVIFLGQLFVTFVLLLGRDTVIKALEKEVDDIIVDYGTENANTSTNLWNVLDAVQHNSKCCGRTNYTQWENNTFIKALLDENVYPCSCFKSACPHLNDDSTQRFGNGSAFYTEGCQERIEAWLRENGYAILGMDAGLVIIQILQFVLSLYLFRDIKRKAKQGKLLKDQGAFSASNSAYAHLE